MNATYKTLGTDDAVNTCDCCGKTNLKFTVVMLGIESGETVHFGSVCATRHSGRKLSVITSEIEARRRAINTAVERALWNSAEGTAYRHALEAARLARIEPGSSFKAATHAERIASDAREAQIRAHLEATL